MKKIFLFIFLLPFFAYSNDINDIIDNSILNNINDIETISENNNKMIKDIESERFVNTAQIRFANKITAKSFTKDVEIGSKIKFGELKIFPLKCWKSYPEEMPENKLLIKVFETNKNNKQKDKLIFYGWIFSSSPSISTIEHQTYDITLENCY